MAERTTPSPTTKLRDALSSRILDGISLPVVVIDQDHKVRVFNNAASKVTGKTEEELYNKPLQDAHPALAEVMTHGVVERAFFEAEASVVKGVSFVDNDGREVVFNFHVDPLIDSKDRVYAATVTAVDVTEVHAVRGQLARQNEQLFALYRASTTLRSSFDLRKTLFILGTALTSVKDALFDFAMVFLVEEDSSLHGTFATERFNPAHIADIWERIDSESSFKRFLRADYPKVYERIAKLSRVLRRVRVSLFQRGYVLTEVANHRRTMTSHDSTGLELSDQLQRIFAERAFAATPLVAEGQLLGVLMVAANDQNTRFNDETKQMLEMMAAQAAVAIASSIAYQRINDRAQRDSLTGLYNHGYLMSRLHEECARAKRYGEHFSFLMIDIDHFKQLNDTFLHQTGDEILLRLSELIQATARESDICARYGGEEFSVVLPTTDATEAEIFAERLRSKIEAAELVRDETGKPIRVTVSIGVAAYPNHGADEHEVIAKADTALYAAKRAGRNRVALAPER